MLDQIGRLPRQLELSDRVDQLISRLVTSAADLEVIQAEISARLAVAEKAKKEAEEAEQVAALNAAQREAVARLVRSEVAAESTKSGRRSFWLGFATNFGFFVLGVVASLITAAITK